jgi:hypothetical protein
VSIKFKPIKNIENRNSGKNILITIPVFLNLIIKKCTKDITLTRIFSLDSVQILIKKRINKKIKL